MNVAESIKSVIRRRKITQGDLAAEMGVGAAYLSDIINGRRRISVEMAIKFSHHLQIDPMRLLTEQVRAELEQALSAQAAESDVQAGEEK